MFTEFKLGDTVKVWPRPGLLVQAHGNTPGRFLSADGEEVTWSNWHYELARAGSIVFTDPSGKDGHRLAEHDDGSAAKAALDAHQAELDAAKAKAEADKQAELEAAAKAAADAAAKAAAPSSSATATAAPAEAPASATKENA